MARGALHVSSGRVVIVGGGEGGAEVAACLRKAGYDGPVTIVGEEPQLPYQRPPLSKRFLSGELSEEKLHWTPPETYDASDIELILGARAESIERAEQRVVLADGRRLRYDRLVLATGGRPRRLTLANVEHAYAAANVHELRTIEDARRLRDRLRSGAQLVVIGGGYIGLEVAATAVRMGAHVTVLEALPRVLARVTAPVVSAFYQEVHRSAGVDVRTNASVVGFSIASGEVDAVVCQDGTRIPADAVLVGIGIVPNVELAARAGLAVDDGILVGSDCRTSDPAILAIGDCTNHPCTYVDRRVRLESEPSTLAQARCAASLLCRTVRPHTAIPWFWSDQYDLTLQTVGLGSGHDQLVLRGDPAERSFLAFYLRNGKLIAADAISRPREFSQLRKLLSTGAQLAADVLADASVPLAELVAEVA
jgi:3-phenylpropionate/trans-cinnamate dioxygenase ferredoxin reductase component